MYDAVAQSTLTMAIGARVGEAHVTRFVSRAQTQSLAHTVTSFRTSCISLIEDARSPSAAGGASNPSWRKNSSRLDNASPEVSLRGGKVVKP